MTSMGKAGKHIWIDVEVLEEFDQWIKKRPWLKQGPLVGSLLRYIMRADPAELMRVLESEAMDGDPGPGGGCQPVFVRAAIAALPAAL